MTLDGLAPNTVDFYDAFYPIFSPGLFVSPSGDLAQMLVFARDAGVVGSVDAFGVRSVLIGIVTFTAGLIPDDTTTFSVGDYDLDTSDTITWENFVVLDDEIGGSSISITTVIPAPSVAVAVPLAGFVLCRRRRSR
jgi:hypothetical protein